VRKANRPVICLTCRHAYRLDRKGRRLLCLVRNEVITPPAGYVECPMYQPATRHTRKQSLTNPNRPYSRRASLSNLSIPGHSSMSNRSEPSRGHYPNLSGKTSLTNQSQTASANRTIPDPTAPANRATPPRTNEPNRFKPDRQPRPIHTNPATPVLPDQAGVSTQAPPVRHINPFRAVPAFRIKPGRTKPLQRSKLLQPLSGKPNPTQPNRRGEPDPTYSFHIPRGLVGSVPTGREEKL